MPLCASPVIVAHLAAVLPEAARTAWRGLAVRPSNVCVREGRAPIQSQSFSHPCRKPN
ncbi:hypothetical protein PSP6_150005 [Paraburkholderia tropica]|nr:hypothetical protein PSP6_150005 [Paraburkholderia tropica]